MTKADSKIKRILFCGYAPVHFVCFQPIYKRLTKIPLIDVYFSGGLRIKQENGEYLYDTHSLYRPFHVPKEKILPHAVMRRQSFDMVFCSFVSGTFPNADKMRIHLFHGVSFRNMAVRRDILIYDRLFIVGPYQNRLFQKTQLLRKGDPRAVPIGFPKLDRLVDGSLDKKGILERVGFTGRRPILIYAPTGQKHNSLKTVGEEIIKRLKNTQRYDLLIKPHDHPRDNSIHWPNRLRRYADPHTKILRDYDIVPYLFISDLLITDASSVSSEYSLLDRPMVFLDVPELLESAREKGVPLDLDTWGRKGGVTARWPDEAVDGVGWSLNHPKHGSAIRKEMARDLFFNPGNATDKAVDWILSTLKLDERHPNDHGGS
ncbi:MAG: CDP-glycerol glycerophosphotransferase family protein [Bacteroidota bacterium]